MKDVLEVFGSVPVTTAAIASLYPEVSGTHQKVAALDHSGKLLRLKRGLYVVHPEWSGRRINKELVANHLYAPSYVSMLTALRWHGLIPERVALVQSMSLKHSRRFENALGSFDYICVDRAYFQIGLCQGETDGETFIIASPEKALCDLVCATPGVVFRYQTEARAYLEEDLRLDMEAFHRFDQNILRACAKAGKKTGTIETLIKLIDR